MVLKDIIAISGEQGLFRFLAQGKNAIIVEHLETKKRSSAHSSAKVSSLDDIAIFTESEDMPLSKVFDLIYEKQNGEEAPDPKTDPAKLMKWFSEVLPDYSKNRVYTSDIRKVAQWYNILHKLGALIREEPEKSDEAVETKEDDASVKDETTAEKNEEQEVKPKRKKKQKEQE
jgi:hypothetical protein